MLRTSKKQFHMTTPEGEKHHEKVKVPLHPLPGQHEHGNGVGNHAKDAHAQAAWSIQPVLYAEK